MFLRYLMIILMVWVRYFTWSFKRKKKKGIFNKLKSSANLKENILK